MAKPTRREPVQTPAAPAAMIVKASHQGPASALAPGQADGEHIRQEGR